MSEISYSDGCMVVEVWEVEEDEEDEALGASWTLPFQHFASLLSGRPDGDHGESVSPWTTSTTNCLPVPLTSRILSSSVC